MRVNTPIGTVEIALSSIEHVHTLRLLLADDVTIDRRRGVRVVGATGPRSSVAERVAEQLREYFAGTRRRFTIPLLLRGSRFSERVWAQLRQIAYGSRVSYSQLADFSGVPTAVRAVAHAVAMNPLPIFIPCHRVVRKDGRLGEYGLHTIGQTGRKIKEFLLNLENQYSH